MGHKNINNRQSMQCQQNQELWKKYKTTPAFAEHMNQISCRFKEYEQQAYYSQAQQSAKKMIIPLSTQSSSKIQLTSNQSRVFIVVGVCQPPNIEKIILNIIHLLPRPQENYTIIYINSMAPKDAYNDFIKATQFLPIEYFKYLSNIYVLHASFLNKARSWISFNTITSFVKSKTEYCSLYEELSQKMRLNDEELLNLLPLDVRKQMAQLEEYVDSIVFKQAKKFINHFDWEKHKSEDVKYESQDKQRFQGVKKSRSPIFKSAIHLASTTVKAEKKAQKRHIEEYQIGQTGAPLPLELLIYYFNDRENLLRDEGMFRKSVSIDDENEILAEIDNRNYNFIESVTNPHLIANAIKRFTMNFIVPVFPYHIFQTLMDTKVEELTPLVIECVKGLSEVRRKALMILCQFFIEKVIPQQSHTKMGLKNICIVLGPCLMRAETVSFKDFQYSQKIITVTSIIFKEFKNIFGNKRQREESIRLSAKNYGRNYLEERLGNYEAETVKNEQTFSPSNLQQQVKGQYPGEVQTNEEQQRLEMKVKLYKKISMTIKEQLDQQQQLAKEIKWQSPEQKRLEEIKCLKKSGGKTQVVQGESSCGDIITEDGKIESPRESIEVMKMKNQKVESIHSNQS